MSTYDDDLVEELSRQLESTTTKKFPGKPISGPQNTRRLEFEETNAEVGPGGNSGTLRSRETYERGEMTFARRHQMTLVNTLFPHKLSRNPTWHSTDGVTHIQVDYSRLTAIQQSQEQNIPGSGYQQQPRLGYK